MEPQFESIARHFCDNNALSLEGYVDRGAFKECYRASESNGNNLAVKIMGAGTSDIERTKREVDAMARCESPFIAKFHGVHHLNDHGGGHTVIIEEFLEGGHLQKKLDESERLDIEMVKAIGSGVAKAIAHLNTLNLVHRDIKPTNIMFRLDSPSPVLVDFSIVRNLGETSLTGSWAAVGPGTPLYASPEQLNNDKALIKWRSDQFCLGLSVGLAVTGNHPFRVNGMSDGEVVDAMRERRNPTETFKTEAKALGLEGLATMLAPWPVLRFQTVDQMISVFE